jgi:hypothetical protein
MLIEAVAAASDDLQETGVEMIAYTVAGRRADKCRETICEFPR